MVQVGDPWAIDGVEYTAQEFRQGVVGGIFLHDTDPQSCRPGVLSGLGASVSGLTWTVNPGNAVVTPVAGASGSYLTPVPVDASGVFDARDATYTRWDRLYLQVQDTSIDGSGEKQGAVRVAKGTPAPTPADPALPAGALPLYRAVVPVTGNVALVDQRAWTAPRGGVLVYTSSSRPTISVPPWGQPGYEIDTKTPTFWDGSQWRPVSTPYVPPAPDHVYGYLGAAKNVASTTIYDIDGWAWRDNPTAGVAYTAAGTFTVKKAGIWQLNACVSYGSKVGGGYRQMRIYKSGTIIVLSQLDAMSARTSLPASLAIRCNVNDTIRISAYHNSGSTETLDSYTTVDLTWLGS